MREALNGTQAPTRSSCVRAIMSSVKTVHTDADLGRAALRGDASAAASAAIPKLQSMLSIDELSRRPSRPPDHVAENRALLALAQEMAVAPSGILHRLAETALTLCRAHSAGLSLLEDGDGRTNFHWRAIAGQWAPHLGGGTPRDFGPCGTVLDRNVPLMCSHPELDFPYWAPIKPVLEEALLIPFYIRGEAVGTIWVVAHDTSRRFDAEDLRVMKNLGTFAAAAYQALLSLNETQRSAAIVDSSDDAIVGKDLNGVITNWNRGAQRLFGYAVDEVLGKPVTILSPADRQDEEQSILQRIGRGERIEHFETIRRRKDGSLVEVSLGISPIKNAEGKVIGASKIARDITERKRSDERIALLAREVDHRAKNLLALTQAIVQLTPAETIEDFRTAVEGRLQALASVHSILSESSWVGAHLQQLVSEQLAPYRRENELRARSSGPNLLLNPTAAQAMAMVLHELTTNAVKYGALLTPSGSIEVDWRLAADGAVVLRWVEASGPPVKPPTRQGFGTKIIERTVRDQLGGDVRFEWRPEGLVCEIATTVLPSSI
jgi:PAS domain S-box-containing protein